MTNEILADSIKNNSDKKLINVLWERVQKLLYLKTEKSYKFFHERFNAVGIEKSDIKQECYFVFLEALEAYHVPYKFVTFLEFPFKKMISRLLKNGMCEQEIYSKNLFEKDSENSYSISETIADENSDIFLITDKRTDSEIIHEEVEKLSPKHKEIINLYYFYDKTDTEIADIFGNKTESICQLRHRALSNLKRSAILRKLYFQPNPNYGKSGFLNPENFYMKLK